LGKTASSPLTGGGEALPPIILSTKQKYPSMREILRQYVRSFYTLQQLRIEMGNRIVAQFKTKIGIVPGKKEENQEEDVKDILDRLRADYKKITDGVKREIPLKRNFVAEGLITEWTELALLNSYIRIENDEDSTKQKLKAILEDFPIWTEYLKGVRGCGPGMAGVIISEIDIHAAQYPSSLWKYAGYDVKNGKGRNKRWKDQLEEIAYIDKNGDPQTKLGLGYNPFLKTKLYVLAGCFIKAGNQLYGGIYRDYKNRLENHQVYGIANEANRIREMRETYKSGYAPKLHRNNMAMRYMIKRFLADLYINWRTLEGLPVAQEYSEAKLGKVHKMAA
jgi:hypothetical protein